MLVLLNQSMTCINYYVSIILKSKPYKVTSRYDIYLQYFVSIYIYCFGNSVCVLHIKALAETKQKISLRVRSEMKVPFCKKANL